MSARIGTALAKGALACHAAARAHKRAAAANRKAARAAMESYVELRDLAAEHGVEIDPDKQDIAQGGQSHHAESN